MTKRVPEIRFEGFNNGWEQCKLEKLGKIQTGNTPSTKDISNYSENGVLWVTPTDIKSLVITDTAKKLSKTGIKKARIAKAGSILVTSIASIGKNTLILEDSGFNQQINSLTPSTENDSYFLLTQSELWSKKMKHNASSGTMQIVNKSEFSNIEMLIPTLEEQKKIGVFFKYLDDTIALHQRKLEQLQSMKNGFLQKMFPKDGEKEPEIRFPGFTDDWEQCKLGDIADIKDSARISNELWVENGIPYLRSSDLVNGELNGELFISKETYEGYASKTGAPQKDDVLFTSGGKVGVVYHKKDESPVYVQGGAVLYVKTSTSNLLDGSFLSIYFSSPRMQIYMDIASSGGTIKHFTLKPANASPIIFPSLSEQQQVGSFFKLLDDTIALHQRELELLKQTKKAFLQKMFV